MVRLPFVIMSAELAVYDAATALAQSHALAEDLRELGYFPQACDGVYNGVREVSWLVPLAADYTALLDVAELSKLAQDYGQESILYVQFSGRATLIFGTDPDTDTDVGTWRELATRQDVGADTRPIGQRNYTEIEGRFYVAS